MKIDEYISWLRKNNIIVTVQNSEVKIRANKEDLSKSVIIELKSRKKEILNYFNSLHNTINEPVIPKTKAKEYYALSSIQKRLYFIQELNKKHTAYNLTNAIILKGKLDEMQIQLSLNKLIKRHEILRTAFVNVKGEVYQKIQAPYSLSIKTYKESIEDIDKVLKEFNRPFNLEKGNLLRVGLVIVNEEEHVLLTDIHHIISDGISQEILTQEFLSLYNNKRLPENKLQFKDYSEWLTSEAEQKRLKESELFWLNEFSGELPTLNLPMDFVRPKEINYNGKTVNFIIENHETQVLKRIASDNGTTMYAVLLSVLNILLYKLSGQQNIVIGTPTSGRNHTDLESMLGAFINTLPIKNHIKPNRTFKELLLEVKEKTIRCFDNQKYPYEELINKLDIDRTLNRNPLFDVMFTYQNYDFSEFDIKGLEVQSYDSSMISSLFDWHITSYEIENQLSIQFTYQTSLFTQSTIERFSRYFQNIISEILINSSKKISEINILTENELRELLVNFNSTETQFPSEETIISLFEKQAEKTPLNIAVKYGEETLTYEELLHESTKIAYYLKENKKVGAGDFIGVFLERELYLLPVIFGILKSGAAYVPISLDFPEDRIKAIVEDTQLKTVISREEYSVSIKSLTKDNTTDIEDCLKQNINFNQTFEKIQASDVAYVIYTSGSTGKPKGVMIEHRSVVNRILWMQNEYPLNSEDVLLQKTAIVFDVSVWELFWWSFTGASLYLLKPDQEKDPQGIIETIKKEKVTTIHFVPSMFSAFLMVLDLEKETNSLQSLKRVFTSGEALNITNVNEFEEKIHNRYKTRLINLYGPTEATVDVSYHECKFPNTENNIPIGKPIQNIRLHIVDTDGSLLPVGVPGELCIAGVGLAREYKNNIKLTNSKFVSLPKAKEKRVYKTGDIAKRLKDGAIEFIGRKDNQVKVRGYRIELGEIEYHLNNFKTISQVVVLVKKEKEDNYLVAYYVSNTQKEIEENELISYLKEKLPEYMIPSFFISLIEMPLSVSGKINRKAFPEINKVETQMYIAPRNKNEEVLVKTWIEALNLKEIGIKDNFFRIGGDSIKAIKLIYNINKELNAAFVVADLYSYQTIEELVTILPKRLEGENENYIKAKKEIENFQERYYKEIGVDESIEVVYPMSSIEKGMTYYTLLKKTDENSFHNILYHEQNLYRIAWKGFDFSILKKAIMLLMQKHSALRKVYDLNNFAHIIKKQIKPELHYIDVSHLPLEDRIAFGAKKMDEERLKSTNFSKEVPLWRMNFIKTKEDFHYMLFDMHHSVFDGWSLHAFLTELKNTYISLEKDANYIPEKLQSNYYDQILNELVEVNSEKSNEYWNTELDNYVRYKFPKTGREHNYITQIYDLGKGFRKDVEKLAEKLNTTLKNICLAAYVYTLSRYNYENDITIGTITNTRPLVPDGDKILGCFLNTVPFRAQVPNTGTWSDYINYIDNKVRNLKAHERVPFSKILEIIDEPVTDENPVFDVAFNFIDFWIIEEMQKHKNELVLDKDPEDLNFATDNNDVNQNTLFDFHIITTNKAFNIIMEYSTSIMTKELADEIYESYQETLAQFVFNGNDTISSEVSVDFQLNSSLLDDDEIIDNKNIVSLFEDQVNIIPNKEAVKYTNGSWNYMELNKQANKIANYLKNDKGVKQGDLVGVFLERGAFLLPSIFAVLKVGAAYVPIDTSQPRERILKIIQDANITVCISQENLISKIKEPSIDIVNLNKQINYINELSSENLDLKILGNTIAYVIYTSGSTGTPKGVAIKHESVINLIEGLTAEIPYTESEVVLSLTTISFDIFVAESIVPIVSGLGVVLANEEEQKDANLIAEIIKKNKVGLLQMTPSRLELLLMATNKKELLDNVEVIMVSGEVFPESLLKKLKEVYNGKIYNLYGPTEATVFTTLKELTKTNKITIGTPLTNAKLYILGKDKKILPNGIPGELYIGGKGLFKEYVNNQGLTKEKLFRIPQLNNQLFYKTGDLVVLNEDEELEFIDRIDTQIKIRGFRIELGEIESHFNTCYGVEKSVVLVKEIEGEKKIVAYYTSDEDISTSVFRTYLSNKLPSYMIPELYIQLETFPLTVNGKINKKQLPIPQLMEDNNYEAPINEIEKVIVEIWSVVLSLDMNRISVTKNFFELGGNSLRGMNLINKLNKEFDKEFPLTLLFKMNTIREFSKFIEELLEGEETTEDKAEFSF